MRMNHVENIETTVKMLFQGANFNGKNAQIGTEYLSGAEEKSELLSLLQPQRFALRHDTGRLEAVLKAGPSSGELWELQKRFVKLTWAAGRCSSIYFWRSAANHFAARRDRMVELLGEDAVIAMELENLVEGMLIPGCQERVWAYARKNPEGLLQIGRDNARFSSGIELLTAGLVLACAGRESLCDGLWDIIRQNLIRNLGWLKLDAQIQQAVTDYLEQGDPGGENPLTGMTGHGGVVSGGTLSVFQGFLGHSVGFGDLMGAVCFLAMGREPAAECGLRICAVRPMETVRGVLRVCDGDYLSRNFQKLVEAVPGEDASMLLILHYPDSSISNEERMQYMRRCIGGLNQALDLGNEFFRNNMRKLFPQEFASLKRDDRMDIVRDLCRRVSGDTTALQAFLLGTGPIVDIDKAVTNPHCSYLYAGSDELRSHIGAHGWTDLSCRYVAAVVLGLKGNLNGYFLNMMQNGGPEFYRSFSDAMLQRELSIGQLLTILGVMHDDCGLLQERKTLTEFAATAFLEEAHRPGLVEALKTGNVFARQAAIRALGTLGDKAVLAACSDSSKQVKEVLMEVLPKHPEWVEDYAALLKSKKAAERLVGVELLSKLGVREVLESALATEKNAKVADAIRAGMGVEAPAAAVGSPEELAERILKGNKIRKLAWLTEKPLPALHRKDGTDVSENIRNAILLSYAELGRIGRSDTAKELAVGIRNEDLARLALEVFELWMGENAPARQKWVLPFAAVFGGSAMTPRLTHAINDWPNNARGAIACDAVCALALSDDPAALVTVDAISRKFKFRQVKVAAGEALSNAAQELGITTEELADRIVPTLDFDKSGKRVFDYGKRSFTVRLTPTLELDIVNDSGKAVKNLPAPGKTDDEIAASAYEAFKAMKKQIKTTVTAQRARLESALSVSRCWEVDRWRALFVENPIMHQFAMSLIWGVYEDGTLTDTFRYMEDGSFNTVDEEEYELPGSGLIGLVHPVELDSETLEGWKQQLEDYEITQAVEQLGRPVYSLGDTDPGMQKLEAFGGKVLNGLSLQGKLLGQGWYRGSVVDGGAYYDFYREDSALNLAVELHFSGAYVGDENEDVTVFDAVFYKPGTVKRGSYTYDSIKPENTYSLGDIPKRYYSEILLQLTRATASSRETNPDWRNMEGK